MNKTFFFKIARMSLLVTIIIPACDRKVDERSGVESRRSHQKVDERSGVESRRSHKMQLKLDGLFRDWQNYKVGWPETGKEGVSSEHDIDVKEFYYITDNNYLYLFFKCIPSILERYQKHSFSGNFAYLYIDSDSNKGTGASKIDHSCNSAMLGTDYRIWVPLTSPCGVWYDIHKWDSSSKDFSIQIRRELSSRSNSLIAHGDDGVEIALLLSDIQMSQGHKFDFICLEWANNESKYANRIQIKIE